MIGRAPHPAPGVVEAPGDVEGRPRAPAQAASRKLQKSSAWEHDQDRRLRPLIIAVLALPLPPGAARRIAQMVVEEFILAGGPLRMQLRQLAGLRAELEGALILAAKDDRRISP